MKTTPSTQCLGVRADGLRCGRKVTSSDRCPAHRSQHPVCSARKSIGQTFIRCQRPTHETGPHLHRERSGFLQHWED
jgi:hypothetical protein